MTFLKNAAFLFVALAFIACGNPDETSPANSDAASEPQSTPTSEENAILRRQDEIKDLTQPSRDENGSIVSKSVYSTLSLAACERIKTQLSPSKTYKCPGYKDWGLYVRDTEGHFTLAVGQAPDFLLQDQSPNTPGDRIEWRLKDGKLHALIYPLKFNNPESPERKSTILVVASLPTNGESGCAQALIKQGSKQNDAARRYADMLNDASNCPNDPATLSGQ